MRKKAVQEGRSEQRGESYSGPYGELLSEARTRLAVFFRIPLENKLALVDIAKESKCPEDLALDGQFA